MTIGLPAKATAATPITDSEFLAVTSNTIAAVSGYPSLNVRPIARTTAKTPTKNSVMVAMISRPGPDRRRRGGGWVAKMPIDDRDERPQLQFVDVCL